MIEQPKYFKLSMIFSEDNKPVKTGKVLLLANKKSFRGSAIRVNSTKLCFYSFPAVKLECFFNVKNILYDLIFSKKQMTYAFEEKKSLVGLAPNFKDFWKVASNF